MTRSTGTRALALAALLLALFVPRAFAAPLEPRVVNGDERGATIRFDVDGDAVDAHDGEIQRFGDRYFLYGTSYGCGYEWQRPGSPFCGFRAYSSPDLTHWTDEGPLFAAGTPVWQGRCDGGTYGCFRPHASLNERTGRYVLWINSYDGSQGYHAFESSSPAGPFTERDVPVLAVNAGIPPGVNNGDHDLFVDDDGTAYLAYTDWRRGGDIVIEELDRRWLSGTGRYVRVGVTATEAPSLFRRGGRYYLTLSDPNCGYCTTGTSYFTASSPLGPWQGRTEPGSWRVEGGELLVDGGDVGLSRAGADWSDYDLSFDAVPLATGDDGAYAQAGWVFRAGSAGDGYAWLLGNYPHPGAEGGNLTKVVLRGGGVASAQVVKLPFAVEAGHRYAIETRLRGDRIVTLVDGQVVDETADATYSGGRVGFRESAGDTESARFDNVRVTAPDGAVLLEDGFDGDLAAWEAPPPRRHGVRISADSCGGQPADVAELPARGGPVYLFQSDRWNNAAPNEALATHYWEPLRFDAAGEILPLRCGASYDLPLAGAHPGADRHPRHLDQTSGAEGFRAHSDIARLITRAQTFTAGRTGTLTRVAYTTHQVGHPTAPLTIQIAELDASGRPGRVLYERAVAPADVSWSPSEVAVEPDVRVRAGRRYAIVLRAPDTPAGAYGLAYNDGDPYARGEELFSADGGAGWRVETGRDLKFETSVSGSRRLR
jgi:Glycosyl hydrolases family 43